MMFFKLLADAILLFHLLFICFSLFGGLFVLYRKWVAWFHLPTACWSTVVGFTGWLCPLTPLEKHYREASGEQGYAGGFIEHYLIPVIYPPALDMNLQWVLGFIALFINLLIYLYVFYRYRKRSTH